MSGISRRDFLAGLTAAGAAALATPLARPDQDPAKLKKGTDLVKLGRSGIQPTVLGIGTGTVGGSQQRAMGQEKFTALVRHALDRGVRYIDTADMYKMHTTIRKALEGVPREKYFIQTKTRARRAEAAQADIDRFRRELGVDWIDSVLMHAMMSGNWPTEMRPVMDALQEAKQKKWVRAVGVSCHSMGALAAAVECEWLDVLLVRINPFGINMDGKPEEVVPLVKKVHANNRGVIGMKVYGETGFKSRQERFESLRYVLGLGCVDAFTIGFTSIAQLDETLELIEQAAT